MSHFTEEKGLHRSLEIAADLNNIAKASTLEHAVVLKPSANSAAYREYLIRLVNTCTEEDATESDKIEDAALRCAALLTQQFSSGTPLQPRAGRLGRLRS